MITVVSRQIFETIQPDDSAVISVWSLAAHSYRNENILDDWDVSLRLDFDDVINLEDGFVRFNSEMADKILRFALDNKDRDFIIHCDAGVSRSAAIGSFLGGMLETEVKYVVTGDAKDSYRNATVYTGLQQVWRRNYA